MTIRIRIHKMALQRMACALFGIAVVGGAAFLSGCSTPPPPKEPRLAWPEPPEKARIEFVRSIVDDEDLGKDTTSTQSILKFLEGEKPSRSRIVEPMGIAVSDDGNRMYVSDHAQGTVFAFDFKNKTLARFQGDSGLASPMGIALDAQENVYVVDQERKGVAVFDRTGKQLRFITDPSIIRPTGIAIDSARGKVYVADTSHAKLADHTVKVFNLEGKFLGKVGVGKGQDEGAFLFPTMLAVDQKGDLYVADTLNSRVQEFDPDGKFIQIIGGRGTSYGQFDKPKGVAVDSFGNIYVVDSGWSNVQIFNNKGRILLFFGGRGTYPGLLQNPASLAIDKQNRIYVGDMINHRINIYQLVNTSAEDSAAKDEASAKKADAAKKEEAPAKQEVPAKKEEAPAK
jgi:DNA-binding beta-propeller fold protein YncE